MKLKPMLQWTGNFDKMSSGVKKGVEDLEKYFLSRVIGRNTECFHLSLRLATSVRLEHKQAISYLHVGFRDALCSYL